MAKFPSKFISLGDGEEVVRVRSIAAIEESEDCLLHLDLCEKSANAIYHFIHRNETPDADDLIICLLGMRVFNCLNATLKLILSGYYQASTLQHRDMVETLFLLDYFSGDLSRITRWREADDKTLRSTFSPVEVRKALDSRDGFTGKKRESVYKLFSMLAAHPHPRGFQMLRLPDGNYHCGPFFEETAMHATVAELGKTAFQAASVFVRFFKILSKIDIEIKLNLMKSQYSWANKFLEKEIFNYKQIEEMEYMFSTIRD